jgi:hypothetical protein
LSINSSDAPILNNKKRFGKNCVGKNNISMEAKAAGHMPKYKSMANAVCYVAAGTPLIPIRNFLGTGIEWISKPGGTERGRFSRCRKGQSNDWLRF